MNDTFTKIKELIYADTTTNPELIMLLQELGKEMGWGEGLPTEVKHKMTARDRRDKGAKAALTRVMGELAEARAEIEKGGELCDKRKCKYYGYYLTIGVLEEINQAMNRA